MHNIVRGCFKFTFAVIFQGFMLLLIEYFPLLVEKLNNYVLCNFIDFIAYKQSNIISLIYLFISDLSLII